ncbi:MAG: SIMPL domain-containing protein [Bacteroides sp.]|nr:SIMPL domain-containing protein [Bacteroides sp.]MCM1458019.1 SIMPL domain-containing protein [Lachnoclostridium sp.]
MKKAIIPSLLIALGLLALGLAIRSGIVRVSDNSRVVTVRGLSEREVKANKVTWPISYTLVGNDLPSLYSQMQTNNNVIIKYLTSNGLTAEEYSTGAGAVTDNQADRYSSNAPLYRYNITGTVTVTSEQVDLVRRLINNQGEIIKQGIAVSPDNWNNRTIYEYTELNSIKPDMIADATKNAREAANKFAADSGSKIGKIKTAQQGQFSIEDRDPYTPFIKKVRVVTYIDYFIED